MRPARFYSLLSGVLFAAVCAYVGAALFGGQTGERFAAAEPAVLTQTLSLRGIAVRTERSLDCIGTADDGARICAGSCFGVDAYGQAQYAPCSCVYFDGSDGLEYLSPELLEALSVQELEALLETPLSPSDRPRLVIGRAWYYAALADADAPLPDNNCRLEFSSLSHAAEAELIHASAPENGSRVLLFRLTAGDASCLRLRQASAVSVINRHEGLLVPTAALVKNGGDDFVYTVTAGEEECVAVDIIYSDADSALVRPRDKASLRAGSRVMISNETERRWTS